MNQFNINNLNYPMTVKTYDILDCKENLDKFKIFNRYKYIALIWMATLYITFAILCSFKIIILHLIILIFLCLFLAYYFEIKYDKYKSKYEKLRVDIIDSLKTDICIHHYACNCKDEYYEFMVDGCDIKLVYK